MSNDAEVASRVSGVVKAAILIGRPRGWRKLPYNYFVRIWNGAWRCSTVCCFIFELQGNLRGNLMEL